MTRREPKVVRDRERWLQEVASNPSVDDDGFRVLNYLAQYADEDGVVTIDNEDGTFERLRIRLPEERR